MQSNRQKKLDKMLKNGQFKKATVLSKRIMKRAEFNPYVIPSKLNTASK